MEIWVITDEMGEVIDFALTSQESFDKIRNYIESYAEENYDNIDYKEICSYEMRKELFQSYDHSKLIFGCGVYNSYVVKRSQLKGVTA